jgi:hypothetical protein
MGWSKIEAHARLVGKPESAAEDDPVPERVQRMVGWEIRNRGLAKGAAFAKATLPPREPTRFDEEERPKLRKRG